MVPRSKEMVEVGWFLAAYGEKQGDKPAKPPHELTTDSWATAYAMFYAELGGGRTLGSFSNSLKNARDAFDAWLGRSGRVGWREEDRSRTPLVLTKQNRVTHEKFEKLTRDNVWAAVQPFADLSVASVPSSVFEAIETMEAADPNKDRKVFLEGGSKVYVSTRAERNPRARADAIRIHGTRCQVCDFDFGVAYGELGRGYVEVHHVAPIGAGDKRPCEINPAIDLAVVCANCHRMLHRKKDRVIPVAALREKISASNPSR
jgi:5-methylcytosine-specific restriction protein A